VSSGRSGALSLSMRRPTKTGMAGVFAGGDVGRGAGAVIDAVAAGRKAASSMDRGSWRRRKVIDESFAEKLDAASYTGKREQGLCRFDEMRTLEALPLEERRNSFNEVERCFTDEEAAGEAGRCLQCDFEVQLAKLTPLTDGMSESMERWDDGFRTFWK
jgi:hypothetical protein